MDSYPIRKRRRRLMKNIYYNDYSHQSDSEMKISVEKKKCRFQQQKDPFERIDAFSAAWQTKIQSIEFNYFIWKLLKTLIWSQYLAHSMREKKHIPFQGLSSRMRFGKINFCRNLINQLVVSLKWCSKATARFSILI